MATLGYATLPTEVVAKNYMVTIPASNVAVPPSYTVTAAPIGAQAASDSKCQNLTVNQAGTKGISGTGSVADCW